jgi:hypothetical protein
MSGIGAMQGYNGLGVHLGNLWRLSQAQTRSISPENPTGAPGIGGSATEGAAATAAADLGRGWKVAPCVIVPPGTDFMMADIDGAGAIQHIWMTVMGPRWRSLILRIYWDDQEHPSVECPLGDFFACGWEQFCQISSIPVCVNPGRAFNCYWEMPFRQRARITLANTSAEDLTLFYQITYTLTDVPEDAAYFHALFRRSNPVEYKSPHVILDGVVGAGQYAGTYLAWGVNSSGWWGEGEIKFFIDDDAEFPTICGTGTEDYVGGAFNFDVHVNERSAEKGYREFTTPCAGLPQVIRPDGTYRSQQRFGMYRWHIFDPIRFRRSLRITIQDLGWRSTKERKFRARQDDVASVAYWYQTLPSQPFPPLPAPELLEVN